MTSKIKPLQIQNIPQIIPQNNQPVETKRSDPTSDVFISKIQEFDLNYSKSVKIFNNLHSKQYNSKWLYNKKKWAEGQLEKIKEIQKLQKSNNARIKNLQNFNASIKKANAFYNNLVKKIQTEIKKSPPLLTFKEHVKPNLVGPIDKILQTIGECMNKIMRIIKHGFVFEKMNDLVGEYQTITPRHMIFFKKILELPEFKVALGLKKSEHPGNHFNHLLDDLTSLRDRQLELILAGRHALNLRDTLPSGILVESILLKGEGFIMALKMLKVQLDADMHDQMNEMINLMANLIENASPRNTQAISDCLYPQCVLHSEDFKAPSATIERSLADRAEASKKEGHLKGFINRGSSNLLEKAYWQAVKVEKDIYENDVFVKGFYSFSMQTPDGHESTSGAELDLSPLGHLSQGQVKKIFDLTTTLLSGRFELLSGDVASLTKDERAKRLILLQKVESSIADLHLSDQKVRKLRQIVSDFSYKMTSAMTLALLTVGHKSV